MGILDEAIREHLELKRSHGADDSELKALEDDAFGPPQRPGGEDPPDPVAEAATEFMAQPDLSADREKAPEPASSPDSGDDAPQPRRESPAGIADLQESPLPPAEEPAEADEPAAEEESEPEDDERPPGSPVEEEPAAEHEAVPAIPSGPNTEERHAIADQPTEMFDVEEEFASSEAPAPADEDLVAEEIAEPRLAPAPDAPDVEDEDDDDFFDHQRLSDELDQALEAPVEEEPESAEHEIAPSESEAAAQPAEPESGEHDALEQTPDFLEEAPEDDELWFEQKPPKDFDFDD